jgi:hypothetical protein
MAYTSVRSIMMSERKVQQHSNVRVKSHGALTSFSTHLIAKFFYAFDCCAAVDRRIPPGYHTSGQNAKAMYARGKL